MQQSSGLSNSNITKLQTNLSFSITIIDSNTSLQTFSFSNFNNNNWQTNLISEYESYFTGYFLNITYLSTIDSISIIIDEINNRTIHINNIIQSTHNTPSLNISTNSITTALDRQIWQRNIISITNTILNISNTSSSAQLTSINYFIASRLVNDLLPSWVYLSC